MKSIIQHLRFPFSLLLMPVYWFALYCSHHTYHVVNTIIVFIILHLLVYPSSNGLNSYYDRDVSSIGLVKNPMPVNRHLLYICISMDVIAIISSFFVSVKVALYVAIYIFCSHIYSHRSIRIKKYAIASFLLVSFCQGFLVFYIVSLSINPQFSISEIYIPSIISALWIASIYPITQVYQHTQDKLDGVNTISQLLGIKGTFIFSAICFFIAHVLYYKYFLLSLSLTMNMLFFLFQIPILAFFFTWYIKVLYNKSNADYKHTMQFNIISALCMNIYFILMNLLLE